MVNLRKFSISDEKFSGFTMNIDLDEINNIYDIIKIVIDELKMILKKHNLEILLISFKKKNFHIHDFNFEDILLSKSDKTFFLCSHCHH